MKFSLTSALKSLELRQSLTLRESLMLYFFYKKDGQIQNNTLGQHTTLRKHKIVNSLKLITAGAILAEIPCW